MGSPSPMKRQKMTDSDRSQQQALSQQAIQPKDSRESNDLEMQEI
jgi:hypothetical protein